MQTIISKAQPVPDFLATPTSGVSGRLMSTLGTPDGKPYPCVLVAHHLPTRLGFGSSVYLVAHCGPSVDMYPYYPIGGAMVVEGGEFGSAIQLLRAVDESLYSFDYAGDPIDFDNWDFDIDDVDSLLAAVLAVAGDELQIQPWDEEYAATQAVDGDISVWGLPEEFADLGIHNIAQLNG